MLPIKITFMSGSQLYPLLRSGKKTGVPFLDSDDLDWMHPETERGQYWVATSGKKIIAIRKFYHWSRIKDDANVWLKNQGLPLVQGSVYSGAYIAVHPDFRRKGIATALNEALLATLKPGDVFVLGTHEPDGLSLNRSWLGSHKGDFQILYSPRYTAYEAYDPTKINFMVTDTGNFGRVASPHQVSFRFLQRLLAL